MNGLVKRDDQSRVPPQAPETESAVLGSMMLEVEACSVALAELNAKDFYRPEHQIIFNEIEKIYYDGERPDMLLLESSLSAAGKLDRIGGTGALVDLTRSVASTANIEYLCAIIREKSIGRGMIDTFSNALSDAYDPEKDLFDVLSTVEGFIYKSLTGETTQNLQTMGEAMQEAITEIERFQEGDSEVMGLSTQLPIDEVISGMQKQKVYILAGRPGMGKTAFELQIVKNIAMQGYKCGLISLEMGNRSLANRLIMSEAKVDSKRARNGKLTAEELERCRDSAKMLSGLGVVTDDSTILTPSLLRVKARMMKQMHGVDLLALDYLQLMQSDNNNQSREQEVAEVSRTCKLISKELDIPVLILAQLSRKPEDRRGWGKRPQNGDLRESGAIEQDADVVMMLFRPEEYGLEVYEDGKSTKNVCEVIITKHRDGPTGFKKLLFQKETMRFEKLHETEPALPGALPGDETDHWWND